MSRRRPRAVQPYPPARPEPKGARHRPLARDLQGRGRWPDDILGGVIPILRKADSLGIPKSPAT
jgi:hypothetical protein